MTTPEPPLPTPTPPTQKPSAPPHPLKQPSFFWFWLGQTVSIFGDRVYSVALPFLLFELGGDAGQLGQLLATYMVPQVLFLLLGGVLVDRLPRRLTMIASDLFHALLLAVVIALLLGDKLELVHLYGLSALFGLASAFFTPASASIVPQLVARESLTQANAVRSLAGGLAGVLGPPLGGLLVSLGGLALALGLDAGTFLLGALCLLAVRPRPRVREGADNASYFKDLREGFGYVSASVWLWVTILVFSVVNIFVGGVTVVLLPLLAETRFAGAGSLGWLFSAVAGGAIVSSALLNQMGRLRRRGLLAYGAVVVSGLGLVGLSFAPQVAWGVAAMFVVGGSIPVFWVVWETTLQALVPDTVLGRVASIDLLGSLALLPLGYLLTGYLAELYPVGQVAFWYGGGVVVMALAGLLVPAVRGLE
ncbi:MFS transporter [soil metagenome]